MRELYGNAFEELGRKGGQAIIAKYGREHLVEIAKRGHPEPSPTEKQRQ